MTIYEVENTKYENIFSSDFDLIDSGFSTGEINMKFDFDRVLSLSSGMAKPMFRLYGWKPWCVSLGANQKEDEINQGLCSEKGFSIVRRPTGGRAVLHADEITYSVVTLLPEHKTVHDLYREIHILLQKSFTKLGIEPEFEKSQPDFRELYKKPDISVSCFASSARYEITWNERKIVGSAQRLFGNTLLQHGSILLDAGHEEIADVANSDNDEKRRTLREYILSHSVTLTEAAGRKISYNECRDAIVDTIIS